MFLFVLSTMSLFHISVRNSVRAFCVIFYTFRWLLLFQSQDFSYSQVTITVFIMCLLSSLTRLL